MPEAGRWAVYPSLRDRAVVVTGGASGIGEAIVEAFARQGSRVVFLDVQDEAARALVQRLEKDGLLPPVYERCDLLDVAAIGQVMKRVLERVSRVDALVNNAGNDTRHTVEEVTAEFWDRTMAVNLRHQFFVAQAVLPGMRRAGSGSVINMGSISWVIPSRGVAVYSTAKAAIVGMTRSLAHDVGADGVRVNCVMPGAILTERQRRLWFSEEYKAEILAGQALKRMLVPEEVARLVLFLAADDSAAITNQSYVIDGGWV